MRLEGSGISIPSQAHLLRTPEPFLLTTTSDCVLALKVEQGYWISVPFRSLKIPWMERDLRKKDWHGPTRSYRPVWGCHSPWTEGWAGHQAWVQQVSNRGSWENGNAPQQTRGLGPALVSRADGSAPCEGAKEEPGTSSETRAHGPTAWLRAGGSLGCRFPLSP